MRIVLTGAGGFVGWHTRLRLHALTPYEIIPITRHAWSGLSHAVSSADAVIHVAGVNRGSDADVADGNRSLADDVVHAVRAAERPVRVVYANSTQADNGTPYGNAKGAAGRTLAAVAASAGATYVDVRLPNLFGEHGRPSYNSFVATFVAAVRDGVEPAITDRSVGLLHVQRAAQSLIDGLAGDVTRIDPEATTVGVREIYDLLQEFKASYDTGEFPDLSTSFRVELFNTYRSAIFPGQYPIRLSPQRDPRGMFVETVRCRGGEGQTSFSTTVPGVTRGEHYHLRKIERFVVVSGAARMRLRRMFTDEVIDFDVTGEEPSAVDMPTGWVHNITNTGADNLFTQFWTHELFRPHAPDTFAEPVDP